MPDPDAAPPVDGALRPLAPPDAELPTSPAAWIAWGALALLVSLMVYSVVNHKAENREQAAPPAESQRVSRLLVRHGQSSLAQVYHLKVGKAEDLSQGEALATHPGEQLALELLSLAMAPTDDLAEGRQKFLQAYRPPPWLREIETLRAYWQAVEAGEVEALTGLPRQDLEERLDWFAQLAPLALDWPGREEYRAQLAEKALPALLKSAAASALIILVLLAIVVVIIIGFRRYGSADRWRWRLVPVSDPRAGLLTAFVLYLLSFNLFGVLLYSSGLPPVLGQWLYLLAVPMILAWVLSQGHDWPSLVRAFGLHQGRGWRREVAAGVCGYLVCVPLLIGLFLLMLALPGGLDEAEHEAVKELLEGDTPAWLIVLLTAGFAPLVEELFFRGAFYAHLRSRYGALLSALTSGILFAMIHPQGIAAWPLLTAVALIMAWLREWRGSLIASITAHAMHNGIITSIALLTMR